MLIERDKKKITVWNRISLKICQIDIFMKQNILHYIRVIIKNYII